MTTPIHAFAATTAAGPLEAFDYEVGPLDAHDVEITVSHCGLCHSDLSMLDNEWGFTQYPFVPGHEVAGTISAVGAHVTNLKVGDRAGLGWHAGYCLTCNPCMTGDHNLCSSGQGTIVGRHGGFADRVRAQAVSVVKLPDGVSLEAAGPLFCGGVTVFNPLVQFGIRPTDRVGVIGIGGLGHMALKFLNAWGCEVTAFTSTESKQAEAIEMGAHRTVNSRDPDAIAAEAGRFDLILSTVNVTLDWDTYVGALNRKGRLHMLGATLEPLNVGTLSLMGGQKSVSSSPVGSPATIATMLEFAARHGIEPQVEVFPMDKANEAIQHLRDGKARYRIVLAR
ncbi:MAG: putative zinc-type alcohol dehydrogenase-like protein [Bradymonadia bacterium]|jgi:uncharacterized zinc-type alcohol dehydrogenase-like protein